MSSIHTFNLEAINPQAVCKGGTEPWQTKIISLY